MGDLMEQLKERVAAALGWSVEDTHKVSLQSLRDLVRPVSSKLAHELDVVIRTGEHITANQPPPKRRRW